MTDNTIVKEQALARIADRSSVIGVIGLGYVGLPLAMEFVRAGFRVVGYDISQRVVDLLMAGKDILVAFSPERVDPGHPLDHTRNTPKDEMLRWADTVVVATDHKTVDYQRVVDHATLVVDTRNVTAELTPGRARIVPLASRAAASRT